MTSKEEELWIAIKNFELDDPKANFSFSDRLARENGWEYDYSIRAILEYKRFIFLICATGEPMTPSDQVDQVWHLHLIYTDSYWNQFCKTVLGREIHHGPTKGGQSEKDKYKDYYSHTKEHYKKYFGEPPVDIWPSSDIRFKEINFRRVNTHRNWIVPKLF